MDYLVCEITFLPFTIGALIGSIFLLLLLALSALFSGSEVAFLSLDGSDIDSIKKRDSNKASTVVELITQKQSQLLLTIIISNITVNIAAAVLACSIFDSCIYFEGGKTIEYIAKGGIIATLLLLFGEVIPKVAATHNRARFVAKSLGFIDMLINLYSPILKVMLSSASQITDSLSKRRSNISMGELSEVVEITTQENKEETKILSGIVRFGAIEVSAIMKHRTDVIALEEDDSFARVKEVINESGFSRIPVYGEDMDDIKGVLYIKDLIEHLGKDEFQWIELLRKPLFVPSNKKINDLLEEFQQRRIHLAIVVDEYGSTQGIVSLEDILEEIVGDISDESDQQEELYTKLDDSTYIFDGKTHISDFVRIMGSDINALEAISGDAETLAGLMLEIKREFLNIGDKIEVAEFSFSVTEIDGRRISKIKVVKR